MPIDKLDNMYKTYDIGKSKNFGIIIVRKGSDSFEVAQFRKDGKYLDGRRPEKVEITGSLKADVKRRDFTINSMGIDADGKIYDYFDGRKDIQNKVIKAVGNPEDRFAEDYLRMLRAARFASRLGFELEKKTGKAIKKLSPNIKKLKPERVQEELLKAAKQSGDKFADYIIMLDKLKILKFILPEVMNLKWFEHNLEHHPEGNVWDHTIAALRQSSTTDPIKNLAILLHDIGKGVTLSHEGGLPRYLNHAKIGMDLVNEIAKRLKMSNNDKKALLFAVGNHMRFLEILNMKPSKVAKLVSDENWDVLLVVANADWFSRGPGKTKKDKDEFEKIVDRAIEIKNKYGLGKVKQRLKIVDGNTVMKITGLSPGPKVGDIIKQVTAWVLDNDITDKDKIEAKIREIT
jgi:tRNA nucleotidyltransferase/poly(A) polymerase